MSGLQTVYCGALVLATGMTWPAPQTWVGLLGVAVCGLTAHYSLAKAFASADAIIVAPMDLLRLPLIALAGVLLYAEPLDPWVLAGGAVVVLGNTVNLWGERHGGRLRPAAGR